MHELIELIRAISRHYLGTDHSEPLGSPPFVHG
jgi:hypothetical protein